MHGRASTGGADQPPDAQGCTRSHGRAGAKGADQPGRTRLHGRAGAKGADQLGEQAPKVLTSLGEQAVMRSIQIFKLFTFFAEFLGI